MSKIQNPKNKSFRICKFRILNLFRIWDLEFRIFKREAGFTLVEALVAIALIASGIVGAMSLSTRSVFNAGRLKYHLVAVNLAQEGIEMIRLIRENNVLCDFLNGPDIPQDSCQWDRIPRVAPNPECKSGGQDLGTNQGYRVDANFISINTRCTDSITLVEHNMDSPEIFSGSCDTEFLRIDSNGVYTYDSGTETPFTRCVYVCNPPPVNVGGTRAMDGEYVCRGAQDDTAIIPAADQMDVVSIVKWNDGTDDKFVRLEQRLYNWR